MIARFQLPIPAILGDAPRARSAGEEALRQARTRSAPPCVRVTPTEVGTQRPHRRRYQFLQGGAMRLPDRRVVRTATGSGSGTRVVPWGNGGGTRAQNPTSMAYLSRSTVRFSL